MQDFSTYSVSFNSQSFKVFMTVQNMVKFHKSKNLNIFKTKLRLRNV